MPRNPSGAGDGVCYCWDVSTGQAVAQLRGHKAGILSATGHASHLATASAVRLRSASAGLDIPSRLANIINKGHSIGT